MLDEYGLTPRQRLFADEYIKSGNGLDAARKAGYKDPAASAGKITKAYRVQEYIAMRMSAAQAKRVADAEEVLLYLSRVMRGEERDAFGLDPSLQERTKAAQELLKRYAVADGRQQATLQRLDGLLLEFRASVQAETAPCPPDADKGHAGRAEEDVTPQGDRAEEDVTP